MIGKIALSTCSTDCFISYFERLNGLSAVWKRVAGIITDIQPEVKDAPEVMKMLIILFSLLDSGNICIALEKDMLLRKVTEKLHGLHLVLQSEEAETASEAAESNEAAELSELLEIGINSIMSGRFDRLFGFRTAHEAVPHKNHPFIIAKINGTHWLFTEKYYDAKLVIEDRIAKIFAKKESGRCDAEDAFLLQSYFTTITRPAAGRPFVLNDEQIEAVARGQKENLFITGGPGAGKTTVVCCLLWELLKKSECSDSKIYLAAPSGKAADRLHESIMESLSNIIQKERDAYPEVFGRLNGLGSHTIHRLLSFNPSTNKFNYNEKNQFDDDSIFIIDEASMIDIVLFKCLLSAIPDKARVFILGDKDQLPSVQAGAVLGELLARKKDSLIQLIKSNRFKDDSEVGILSKAIQSDDMECNTHWERWNPQEAFSFKGAEGKVIPDDSMPVFYFEAENKDIRQIAIRWDEEYYAQLSGLCTDLVPNDTDCTQRLDEIWRTSCFARILCAERKGKRGVNDINFCVHQKHLASCAVQRTDFCAGELLMITKNQSLFNLYNGDSGVVVSFRGMNRQFLMLQKSVETDTEDSSALSSGESGIFSIGSYIFYPLDILPADAIELSYAITVHKAQGSGYNAILVILPGQVGHPLLNRQIVYTAVTRTKGKTFIIADDKTFMAARNTVMERDTMIEI